MEVSWQPPHCLPSLLEHLSPDSFCERLRMSVISWSSVTYVADAVTLSRPILFLHLFSSQPTLLGRGENNGWPDYVLVEKLSTKILPLRRGDAVCLR